MSSEAVKTFSRYLIGQNLLKIEHHWQYLYRWNAFRGAVIMGARSAIDIALWDIAGKYYGVPSNHLLGGPTRDKARVYYHVFGKSREELVQGVIDAKAAYHHRGAIALNLRTKVHWHLHATCLDRAWHFMHNSAMHFGPSFALRPGQQYYIEIIRAFQNHFKHRDKAISDTGSRD